MLGRLQILAGGGAGIYFSEFPSLSMGYVRTGSKFLLAQILLGRPFQCTNRMDGAPCSAGYDSHISPDKQEIIIFRSGTFTVN